MSYSLDLRERIVSFVNEGGNVVEAAKLFKVGKSTIYRWLKRPDLRPTVVTERKRKLDRIALAQHVKQYPSARLIDRARQFGVGASTVFYALRQLKITRKKNSCATEKETVIKG